MALITPEQAKFLSKAFGYTVPADKIAPQVDPVDYVRRSEAYATEFDVVKTSDTQKTATNQEGKYRTKEFSAEEKLAARWQSDGERLKQGDTALQGDHNYVMETGTGNTLVFDNAGQDFLPDGTVLKHHHSSPVSGQEVIGAGTLTAKDGKVTKVSNDSGHYLPRIGALQNTVTELLRQGVMLDTTLTDLTGQGETPETKPLFDLHRQVQKGLSSLEGRQKEIATLLSACDSTGDEALEKDEAEKIQKRIDLIESYLDSVAKGYAALRKVGIAPRNKPAGEVEYKRTVGKDDISGFAFRKGDGTVTQTMTTEKFLTGGTDEEQRLNHAAAMEELKLVRSTAEQRKAADEARKKANDASASHATARAADLDADQGNTSSSSTSTPPMEPPVKTRAGEIAEEYVDEARRTEMIISENTPDETNEGAVAIALKVLGQLRELSALLDPPQPEPDRPDASAGPNDGPGGGPGDGPQHGSGGPRQTTDDNSGSLTPPIGVTTDTQSVTDKKPAQSGYAEDEKSPQIGRETDKKPAQGGYVEDNKTTQSGYVEDEKSPQIGQKAADDTPLPDGNRASKRRRDEPKPSQEDDADDWIAQMQRARQAEPESEKVKRELQWPFAHSINAITNTMLLGQNMIMPEHISNGITDPDHPEAEERFNALKKELSSLQNATIGELQTLEQRIRARGDEAMTQSTLDRVNIVVANHKRVFENKAAPIAKRMGELVAAAKKRKV